MLSAITTFYTERQILDHSATLSHMHGEPVADIVPHRRRVKWLSGEHVRSELADRAAEARLTAELADLAGQTLNHI